MREVMERWEAMPHREDDDDSLLRIVDSLSDEEYAEYRRQGLFMESLWSDPRFYDDFDNALEEACRLIEAGQMPA